jgi:hypothetical protein
MSTPELASAASAPVLQQTLSFQVSSTPKSGAIAGARDVRLDMFRGLALVMIFINHVPGTIFESLTSRNFGFSDAAEAFVLMSGIAAGLAYARPFAEGAYWRGTAKVWARARQLYLVHIATTLMALAIFAGAALWFELPQLLRTINIGPMLDRPLSSLIGLSLLTHQLGYFNILPLYTVLLLATPFLLPITLRNPRLLLFASVVLWGLAGQYRLNLPNFPNSGGWFFNPFSWQLLFVIGLIGGVGMKTGRPFFQVPPWLFWAAAGFVLVILVWARVPDVAQFGRGLLGRLANLGLPFYVTWFDKTYLALPRLLHVLALAIVFSNWQLVHRFAGTGVARGLQLLGRHGLPVFAFGSVLSILLQAVKARTGSDLGIDGVLLGGGLALQLGLAWGLTTLGQLTRTQSPALA